jgi:hypothetical protein
MMLSYNPYFTYGRFIFFHFVPIGPTPKDLPSPTRVLRKPEKHYLKFIEPAHTSEAYILEFSLYGGSKNGPRSPEVMAPKNMSNRLAVGSPGSLAIV